MPLFHWRCRLATPIHKKDPGARLVAASDSPFRLAQAKARGSGGEDSRVQEMALSSWRATATRREQRMRRPNV